MIFIGSRSSEGCVFYKNKNNEDWILYDSDLNDFLLCEIDENAKYTRVKASETKSKDLDAIENNTIVELFPDYKSTDNDLEQILSAIKLNLNLPDEWLKEELDCMGALRASKMIGTIISIN